MAGAVSFGRRIADLARAHPDDPALVFVPTEGPYRALLWGELHDAADAAARVLRRRGVGQGDTVIISVPNSPEHVVATIGAWRLGACVVPLRWDPPSWERERLLSVASAKAIVADWEDIEGTVRVASLRSLPDSAGEPLEDRVPRPAQAIATSGATGAPKLIVDPNAGLFDPSTVEHLPSEVMGQDASQVHLVPAPMYHTNGFFIAHNALRRDELVVLMERFDAARAVQAIEDHRVTSVTMVPTMLLRIARLEGIEKRDLSSLQNVLQGAASCPPWLVRRWIELVGEQRFFMAYGSSERVGTTLIRGDEWLDHPGSVGKGLTTSIRVLDELGRPLPPGEVGEIFLRKDEDEGVAPCEYRGAPPPRRTPDGFTTVGDLGWLDEEGYLYIADRRTDMIVTGGANVYPAEVESAMLEHPMVADVAVIGLPDEEWGTRVHAVVQPALSSGSAGESGKPAALSIEELDEHCRRLLVGFKRPKSFELVESLPRTDAGKLNRSSLVAERLSHR